MWNLSGIWSGVFRVFRLSPLLPALSFIFSGSAVALAACGGGPIIPEEGLIWPASGEIVNSWTLDCASNRGHRGIDIAISPGGVLRAAASGNVAFVGYTPAEGGGTTVAIDHEGGLRSTYLHLAEATVDKGQAVNQGQAIGIAGGTPLHFGLKLAHGGKDEYFNPLDLLPAMAGATGGPQGHAPSPSPEQTFPVEAPRDGQGGIPLTDQQTSHQGSTASAPEAVDKPRAVPSPSSFAGVPLARIDMSIAPDTAMTVVNARVSAMVPEMAQIDRFSVFAGESGITVNPLPGSAGGLYLHSAKSGNGRILGDRQENRKRHAGVAAAVLIITAVATAGAARPRNEPALAC